jgi:hypothetical protein
LSACRLIAAAMPKAAVSVSFVMEFIVVFAFLFAGDTHLFVELFVFFNRLTRALLLA